jgi:hypothetical protein
MREAGGLYHKLEGTLAFTDANRNERYLVILTTDELQKGKTPVPAEKTPMLFIGSAAVEEISVPNAPAGRVRVTLSPLVVKTTTAVTEGAGGGASKGGQLPKARPEVVTVRLTSGKIAGELELGRTTLDEARLLFEHAGAGLGPERQNGATFALGATTLAAKHLYSPPGTSHQLYFNDNGILTLFVDGDPADLPSSGSGFRRRFPETRETGRTLSSYELQATLSPCVTLISVFRTVSDTLDSAAYGYSCPTK